MRRRNGGRRAIVLRTCAALAGAVLLAAALVAIGTLHYLYFNRQNLPDAEPFMRFEFPAVGHAYDTNGQALVE